MAPVLEARGLQRRYGPIHAVSDVSFGLDEGDLLAVFGPNGAGKTTLLGMLAGTLQPHAGEIRFQGRTRDAAETEWRRDIGLLSHQGFLYGALTARENLRFFGRLYDLGDLEDRIANGLERVGLSKHANRPVRGFSRGMRQRLALARTLLHEPSLVLLDEPFTGLDVHASALLRDVLGQLKDGRRTVVLVTHNLAEGLALADRVAIQVEGRFSFYGERHEVPAGDVESFYRERVEPGWKAVGGPDR